MDDVILEDLVEEGRLVTLAEVKNMLEKAQKEREDMTYEQKIALEHARRFARVNKTTADKMVKALLAAFPAMEEKYAIRITDLVPQHPEDVMGILQKARMDLSEDDIANIIAIVDEHYVA
ncbi:MAG: hypothetical protein ACPHID_02750 [Thermoplasmatota archaeon]